MNEYLHLSTQQILKVLTPHRIPSLSAQTTWSHTEAHEALCYILATRRSDEESKATSRENAV